MIFSLLLAPASSLIGQAYRSQVLSLINTAKGLDFEVSDLGWGS